MTIQAFALVLLAALVPNDQRIGRGPQEPGGGGKPTDPGDPGTPDPARFERGRVLFERFFHRSSGVGAPEMNADSCKACHRDPVSGGAGGLELNVSRFGRDDNGRAPFQDLPGGQAVSKLRPPYVEGREEYPSDADVFEQRQTPSLLGDGLIERIPVNVILANEDPLDADGDGIRGTARRREIDGTIEIGRFGWKAQVPRLSDFARDALGGELGLTTRDDGRGFALASDSDGKADPELDDEAVSDLAFFVANLPPPKRTGSLDPEVLLGELVFERVGCVKCHVPELMGPDGPVPLYSDLLLHRVWPDSFRGMSEPGAGVGVYRTPPLWGIRTTAPYLHDGRASNLRAAILAHDGEARAVKKAFDALPVTERSAVIAFLNDL